MFLDRYSFANESPTLHGDEPTVGTASSTAREAFLQNEQAIQRIPEMELGVRRGSWFQS